MRGVVPYASSHAPQSTDEAAFLPYLFVAQQVNEAPEERQTRIHGPVQSAAAHKELFIIAAEP